MSKTVLALTPLGTAALSAAIGVATGWRVGRADAVHSMVGIGDPAQRRSHVIRHAFGLDRFHGNYGQDVWILVEDRR